MKTWKTYCWFISWVFFLLTITLHGKERINTAVIQAVRSMPRGGGYATTSVAVSHFSAALRMQEGSLVVNPEVATPSFCSEATYLVFLKTLLILQQEKKLSLHPSTLSALLPDHQLDGQGFWGCWNANGPGVARAFHRWDLGFSFTDLHAAQPGDFLKIFWTDAIGALEHGHLVVYLGQERKGNAIYLHCWSSNTSDGYGTRSYPLAKMHHLIFSRLSTPQSLEQSTHLTNKPLRDFTDSYLGSLLSSRSTSWAEVLQLCGIVSRP